MCISLGAVEVSPLITWRQPGERYNVVKKSQATIQRVAGRLIQEKKRKIEEAEKSGSVYNGKDLLSALREFPSLHPLHMRD